MVTSKLDATTIREWEQTQTTHIPTFKSLEDFLLEKASLLEKLEMNERNKSPERTQKLFIKFFSQQISRIPYVKNRITFISVKILLNCPLFNADKRWKNLNFVVIV